MAPLQFEAAASGVRSLYTSMGSLLTTVMAVASVVVLVIVVVRMMEGDRDSVKRLFWWLIALAAGIALMSGLQSVFG